MKAMIFAAGLGTRLRPLTDTIPKALVKVNGRPMLERIIKKLIAAGFDDLIINVHHHASQIVEFINENDSFGIPIQISDESDLLLDTGGGLKKAGWFFKNGDPFLVHNADVLSEIDLQAMYEQHISGKYLATLAVRQQKTDRLLLFDRNLELTGWKNARTGTVKNPAGKEMRHEMSFCGIHIIDPAIFNKIEREGVFSIIDLYLDLLPGNRILGHDIKEAWWTDIGNFDSLQSAENFMRSSPS